MSKDTELPSTVIEEGFILIQIPISYLPCALTNSEYGENYYISDVNAFAEDIVNVLKSELEDGTTPVHELLDIVVVEAIDSGSAHAEEIEEDDD